MVRWLTRKTCISSLQNRMLMGLAITWLLVVVLVLGMAWQLAIPW
ncbi:hypothetical protein [Halomonas sp. CSM-2]|nr:hypothetical protein [Halomonas sp. CSM-2]